MIVAYVATADVRVKIKVTIPVHIFQETAITSSYDERISERSFDTKLFGFLYYSLSFVTGYGHRNN
jgi:hypothetical protein